MMLSSEGMLSGELEAVPPKNEMCFGIFGLCFISVMYQQNAASTGEVGKVLSLTAKNVGTFVSMVCTCNKY